MKKEGKIEIKMLKVWGSKGSEQDSKGFKKRKKEILKL